MSGKAYFDSKKLEAFLNKDESVCREERQFAVFLYNVFLEKKRGRADTYENGVVKKCLFEKEDVAIENVYIKDVYFEVTLMRDYFEACKNDEEKNEFNEKLLDFCLSCLGEDEENAVKEELKKKLGNGKSNHEKDKIWQNLGQASVKKAINEAYPSINQEIAEPAINSNSEDLKKIAERAKPRACLQIAGMMMNATPDLLVIYEYEGKLYAKALECKYSSDEGRYADAAGIEIRMQYFIQECIMKFCFGSCENKAHIKKHIPKQPTRGVWKGKDKEPLWELCEEVYEGILLKSELCNNDLNGRINNCGVGVIRFIKSPKDEKELASEIWIPVEDLLANMYHSL